MLMNMLLHTLRSTGTGHGIPRRLKVAKRLKNVPVGEMWGIFIALIVLLGLMVAAGVYLF